MSPPRLRGCSLALAALALGVLAASLLPNCPFRAAVNAQTRTSALGPIPDAIAAALGVQDGALTTAAGGRAAWGGLRDVWQAVNLEACAHTPT